MKWMNEWASELVSESTWWNDEAKWEQKKRAIKQQARLINRQIPNCWWLWRGHIRAPQCNSSAVIVPALNIEFLDALFASKTASCHYGRFGDTKDSQSHTSVTLVYNCQLRHIQMIWMPLRSMPSDRSPAPYWSGQLVSHIILSGQSAAPICHKTDRDQFTVMPHVFSVQSAQCTYF